MHYFDLIQANLLKRLKSGEGGMFSSITHILRSSDLNTARSGKNTTMLLREKVRDKRGCEDSAFTGEGEYEMYRRARRERQKGREIM